MLKINAFAMKHTRVDTMAVNTCRQYNKIDTGCCLGLARGYIARKGLIVSGCQDNDYNDPEDCEGDDSYNVEDKSCCTVSPCAVKITSDLCILGLSFRQQPYQNKRIGYGF